MATFLVLYRSTVSAADQMATADAEAGAASMQAWMAWATRAGEAVVDLGSPTQTVAGGDSAGSFIGGYSILQAESTESVLQLLVGHPHLGWGGTIEVLEMLALPGM